jgi:hypothetical protein
MGESTAITEVVWVTKQLIDPAAVEERVYVIHAKVCLPEDTYLNELFRVKNSRPVGLAKRAPSVMKHGRFAFDTTEN